MSTRANHCGGAGNNPDIYYSQWNPAYGWREPQPLSCEVNSGFEEFSPSVVEDGGMTLISFSSSRDAHPLHKIYMSALEPDASLVTARVSISGPHATTSRATCPEGPTSSSRHGQGRAAAVSTSVHRKK